MPEETPGQSPETATQSEAPTDFREYAKWRETGDLPDKKEAVAETPAAAVEEPPAKTEPDPEPEVPQEPEEQDDEDQTAVKGKGGSRQRKIDRLTRENADLQRQLAAIRETPPAAGSPAPKTAASAPAEGKASHPQGDSKPKLEDFETLEAYQEALTDYKLDERERARRAEDLQRQAHEAEQKIQTEWKSRERAAAKLHDDYDDVIDNVKPPEGPGVLAARQALLEDEAGPEILYYLGKHPDELKRIAALSPVSAVREIGRLSAKLTVSPAPENGKQKITGAPKPPPPSGRPSKTTTDDITDPAVVQDFSRWERLRKAQLERR